MPDKVAPLSSSKDCFARGAEYVHVLCQVLLWKFRTGLIQLQSITGRNCQSQVVVTSGGEGACGTHPATSFLLSTETQRGGTHAWKFDGFLTKQEGGQSVGVIHTRLQHILHVDSVM